MDRIVVASHITPCGRSWVDNLLVALQVKWSYTDYFDDWVHIWQYDRDRKTYLYRHRDKPQRFIKLYCPAILAEEYFRFREDIEAITTHSLPRREWMDCKKVYVVRDFKSALISAYKKRSAAGVGFTDYIAQLDPDLMLPLYLGLQYHVESWLRQDRLHLIRREDYRSEPEQQIDRLIDFLGIDVPAAMRARAIDLTGAYTPGPTDVEAAWEADIAMVEARCRATLIKLGYCINEPTADRSASAWPSPRGFVDLAISCGVWPDFDVWNRGDDANSTASACDAATQAMGGAGEREFNEINAFLALVTGALLNLRLAAPWRAVYGQPVGPRRTRGNMTDALRFVRNAETLFRQISMDLHSEPNLSHKESVTGRPRFVDSVEGFSREGGATFFNEFGQFIVAEPDQPRHYFEPATSEYRGILIEPDGRNLLLHSHFMDEPGWLAEGVEAIIASVVGVPPFDRFTRVATTSAATRKTLSQLVPLRNARGQFTFSIFARSGTLKNLAIQFSTGKSWCSNYFDLRRPAAYRTDSVLGARVLRAAAHPLNGGWVRVEMTFQFEFEFDSLHCRIYLAQDCGVLDFEGAANDHLLVYGAQLEAGQHSTSYIGTEREQMVRHADLTRLAMVDDRRDHPGMS